MSCVWCSKPSRWTTPGGVCPACGARTPESKDTNDVMRLDKAKVDEFRFSFCDLATQYYISGRSAAKCFLVPVYGNLLHHAIEMYLKGALVGTLTVKEMRNKHSHDLLTLWNKFKAKENDTALLRFDTMIDALHKFESIRFPDEIVAKGLLGGAGWAPEDATTFSGSLEPPPKYEVIINLVDELVIELLHRADLNPKFFVTVFAGFSEGREALTYRNPQVGHWLPPEPSA